MVLHKKAPFAIGGQNTKHSNSEHFDDQYNVSILGYLN